MQGVINTTEKEKQEMERLQEVERKQKERNRKNNDIIARNRDRVSVALPKGMKDRITEKGESVNGLVNRLLLEWLENN